MGVSGWGADLPGYKVLRINQPSPVVMDVHVKLGDEESGWW